MTNEGQLSMMKNMLNSAMKAGLPMHIFHCYILSDQKSEAAYNTTEFKKITVRKLEVILMNMQFGEPVVWVDNDIVFFKNCLDDLLAYQESFVMQDDLWGFCTGFFLVRPSTFTKSLIQKCITRMNSETHSKENDQHVFNKVCYSIPTLTLTKLPQDKYPNGFVYSSLKDKSGAVIMHNNYLIKTSEKIEKFIRDGNWNPSNSGFDLTYRYCI
jgi:hypothetical protein